MTRTYFKFYLTNLNSQLANLELKFTDTHVTRHVYSERVIATREPMWGPGGDDDGFCVIFNAPVIVFNKNYINEHLYYATQAERQRL